MSARLRERRLTSGWEHARGPASLGEHHRRYGPLPGHRGLADQVAAAGLTGRGGAGFPTARKLRAVAAGRGPAVVVANGMESEPASGKDQALLARAPHLVLDGAVLAARATGADTVHVCLDRGRPRQVRDVRRAIAERGPEDGVRLEVSELPGHYVSSEASALARWLGGGPAQPAATPPRVSERGVSRRPTLVDNVETLAHLALIARFGPDWFRAAGHPDAPGTMLVTVGGAVRGPGVREIGGGTAVGELLHLAGLDGRSSGHGARYVLIGGYFGTWHAVGEVGSLPLTAAGLAPAAASPGAGVLVALPDGCCGLAQTARILRWLAGESAGQCGPCRFGLPAIAADFAQLADGAPDGDVLARLGRRLGVIPGRGACRHPDGAAALAASALRAFGADARMHAARRPCAVARSGAWSGHDVPGLPLPARDEQQEASWR